MRNPAYDIQDKSYTALAGNLLVDSQNIEVFDEFTDDNAVFPRVILEGITGGGPVFTKCGFGGDWFQNIKVSDRFQGRVTKNRVNKIADQILQILAPKDGPFIDVAPDFTVWKAYGNILNTLSYDDGVNKYIDINIQITYSITES